jgi:hypothetical protein
VVVALPSLPPPHLLPLSLYPLLHHHQGDYAIFCVRLVLRTCFLLSRYLVMLGLCTTRINTASPFSYHDRCLITSSCIINHELYAHDHHCRCHAAHEDVQTFDKFMCIATLNLRAANAIESLRIIGYPCLLHTCCSSPILPHPQTSNVHLPSPYTPRDSVYPCLQPALFPCLQPALSPGETPHSITIV